MYTKIPIVTMDADFASLLFLEKIQKVIFDVNILIMKDL